MSKCSTTTNNRSKLPVRKLRKRARQSANPGKACVVGLDVSDRWSHFCELDDNGEILAEGRLPTTREAQGQYFSSIRSTRVALESGMHSAWLSRLITSLGHEVIVANPRELRKIYQNDRKNDRADARILARIARFDPQLLAPIQHRSDEMQTDLSTLRARDALVSARTKCINSVRGLVKLTGTRLPQCSAPSFAKQSIAHLPPALQLALQPLFDAIASLNEQIRIYDKRIEELAQERYPVTNLLRQISGVGALTSMAFVLTIADPSRFSKSRDVASYLGLVPRQDDSGERHSQLSITKAGNQYMRRLLVGSAQYILGPFGPDCDLRRHGQRMTQNGGKNSKKRAVVAIARKLAVVLHRLWTTGEAYRPLRAIQTINTDQAA